MQETWIGKKLGGCTINRELRRGGMSVVYVGTQESIGREVAIKVLSAHLLGDPAFMERFNREVATTATLQHPHIIPIYDFGEAEGVPYVVMAYIPGGSVEDLLNAGPVPLHLLTRIVQQVADALDFAHSAGVIHRDIKPANILLDRQQNAILTDFGIARVVETTQMLTQDALVGTPSYIAPELITETQPASPASDIYGLGVTAYQMLAGELPFPARTAVQTMWAHVHEPVPLLAAARPDLPDALDIVIQKALAKLPEARYNSAGSLADDLAGAAAGLMPAQAGASPTVRVAAPPPIVQRLEEIVQRVIDQVVKVTRPEGGSGAGIYLPGDHVLTCLHVVNGAAGLSVGFRTGERLGADVIAADASLDLALLMLQGSPTTLSADRLDALLLAEDLGEMEPGAPLAAIGHPLGLDWAVTGGHFNALRLPSGEALVRFGIKLSVPLVQVDVAINPGNSGGPLIDLEGRLIGVADSVINPALANDVGFAIVGSAAKAFWEAHRDDSEPLVAYTCGHHHAPGETFCPLTGRPIQPARAIPMAAPGMVRYSCGHLHPPGLAYCPLTGKPARALEEAAPAEVPPSADEVAPPPLITCAGCKREFPASERFCPHCGRRAG